MIKALPELRIVVIVTIMSVILSGCASSTTSKETIKDISTSSSVPMLEKVPVSIYVPGDRPKQQDEVLSEINKNTQMELNIDLKVNYIPWGDYINQVNIKSAGGEDFDIYLNFFGELTGNIAKKQCIPLNDLLDKYGLNLKKQIPQDLWKSSTFNDKIYGIPAVYAMTEMGRGFLVRKDLREKYNLPEITNDETYKLFLSTIKKNEKNIIPMIGDPVSTKVMDKKMIGHSIYTLGCRYLYIDIDKKPFKVENYFKTEAFKTLWKENIEAYKNGWVEKDILTDNDFDGKFISGLAAAMNGDLYNITERQNALKKNVPAGEIELAIINKSGRWINMNPVNNFALISSTSKNPDRAMMFMNWLRESQENYDLYMLGIPGKTYNLVGEKAEVPAGVDPKDRYNPTPWFTMHMPYMRSWTSDPPAYIEALKFWKEMKPESSELMGFSYSSENVKAEKAAVEKVYYEEGRPLEVGILTTEADYNKFIEDLDKAGLPKIIEETQKQLDNYMLKNYK